MNRLALLILLCVILPGCTANSIRLDEFEDLKINESRPKDIKAESCGFLMGVIPFRMKSQLIRLDRQYRYSANGGAITNVRVQESWYWWGIGTLVCTEVRATAYPRLP